MSYAHRTTGLTSALRPSSGLAHHSHSSSTSQQSALQARINEKKRELEHLRQLRDLSAGLAGQMQQLEEKLATLSNGTEAVAAVLSNWNSVLRAIYMASGTFTGLPFTPSRVLETDGGDTIAGIPKPKTDDQENKQGQGERPLPQTLVRIPIQQAEAAARDAETTSLEEGNGG
nr:dash complex subunit dad2 [Quercus suber]